ncbi:hypothetical protein R70723_15740 [Paenibacillus sp. FSL R7-0273]|uniref:FAD-dependent oxidoreductase n=1 Tax=Paenibacillus sp. FSL R7-0273 TaxID=1536772 RepID=UPI0004F59E64|nr:FAD-dependent oxidoreductase [Paenibacillus sp. FSL R7-0273]AIQ47176.1 hypothetical protein R70723_15740 [Paenibacillus sp. FSL R7-0273]OMF84360.1 hypothetical protein BK144_30290 [Paenibacillus sp. FSL R7-0273]
MGQSKSVRTEVLIVGGGTAGCVAAIAAAEEGAKVILVENDTALGGVATRGGIHRYYYGSPGGLQEEIDRRTAEAAAKFGGKTKGFHPDAKRVVLAALCREKGIMFYLDSVVYEVIKEGEKVAGVRALTPAGRLEISAGVTIDSTGNAHLVRMAGGRLRYGRGLDGVYHNYSFIPRRVLDGEIGYDNLDAGWVDPYDPWDVSRAFIRGREWVREGYAEGAHYFAVSSMLGVREGGLIEGDVTITLEDYIEDRPSPEVICRSYSHLDNHGFDTGNESEFSQLWIAVMGLFVKGLWCDIPYGALLPAGIGNLLVAGRALSVDRDVGMGVRMQKDMHKVGEAAGVAAAMSIRTGSAPRELDRSGLQKRLVERSVLEGEELQRTHGRNLRFKRGGLAGVELGKENAASHAEQLAHYFGTDERWKAVWLLGSSAEAEQERQVAVLLESKLYEGTPEARFCAAITLAMLEREEAVPYLMERIATRDKNKLSNHPKCVPFWIASFVLLRMLKSTAGVSQAAAALKEQPGAVHSTFLLDYLSAVCPVLSAGERAEAAGAVQMWLSSGELGMDYRMHGDRPESLGWSLELRAAALLASLTGEQGGVTGWAASAAADPRGYVRNAAARLLPWSEVGMPDKEEAAPFLGEFDIAVIGAGTAEVICAAALGRQGRRVVLIADGSALMTEVTRSRVTYFKGLDESAGGGAYELIDLLRQEGAWNGEQLEPVLVQLAADRLLQNAGVSVLYEARCLEEQNAEGRSLVEIAYKNGRGLVAAGRIIGQADRAGVMGQAVPGTLTAVLIGSGSLGETADCRWMEWSHNGNVLALRIRPSYYPDEVYLDIRWPLEAAEEGDTGELLVLPAVEKLRNLGVIPDSAALAYIADEPWPEGLCAAPGTSGTEPEENFWIARQISAGLDDAVIG